MKPYQLIPIIDCGEPLIPIPSHLFVLETPHPYQKLGAPYDHRSPFYLRVGVLTALTKARIFLHQVKPNWQLQIFDAYRPLAVQQFMVDYAFREQVRQSGIEFNTLSEFQRQEILSQVYEFWAIPSSDPKTPPPHSTGAAVDVTLVDEGGALIPMGSPIDEISPHSLPHYFVNSPSLEEQAYHQHRQLLGDMMKKAGFHRHPNEWWHFCLGDQMWVWLSQSTEGVNKPQIAYYGGVL